MKLILIALQLFFTLVNTETNPSPILSSDVGKTIRDVAFIGDNEGVGRVDVSSMSEDDKILRVDENKGNEQDNNDRKEKADQDQEKMPFDDTILKNGENNEQQNVDVEGKVEEDLEKMAFDENDNESLLGYIMTTFNKGLESGNSLLISPIIDDHNDDTAHDDPKEDEIITPEEDNEDASSGRKGKSVTDNLAFDDHLNADEEYDDGDDNIIYKDQYKNDQASVALDDYLNDYNENDTHSLNDQTGDTKDTIANDDVVNTNEESDQNRSDIQDGVVLDEYVYDDNDDDVKNINDQNDQKGGVHDASAFDDYLNNNEDNDDGIENIDKDKNIIIGRADSIAFDEDMDHHTENTAMTLEDYYAANFYDTDEVNDHTNVTFDDYIKAGEESENGIENINKDDDQSRDEFEERNAFDDENNDNNTDDDDDVSEFIYNSFSNSIETTDNNYNGNASNDDAERYSNYTNDQYEDGVQYSGGSNEYANDETIAVAGSTTRTFAIASSDVMTTKAVILPLEFTKVTLKTSVAKGDAIKLVDRLELLIGKFKPKKNPLQTLNQILPILRGIRKHHTKALPPGFNLVIVEMIKEIEKKIELCPVQEEMSVYLQSIISFLQNLALILRSGMPLPSITFNIQVRLMKKDVICARKQTINLEPYKTQLKIKLLELMASVEKEKSQFTDELQDLYEEVDCMSTHDVEESHKGLKHIESIINALVVKIGEKVSGEEKNEVCTGLEGIDNKLKSIEVILSKLSIGNTGGVAVAGSGRGIAIAGNGIAVAGNGIAIAGGTNGIGDPMLILVKLQDYLKWVDASDSSEEAKFVANSVNLHIEFMLKYGNEEYFLRYMGLLHKFHIVITLKTLVNGGTILFSGGEEQELTFALQELVKEGLTSLKDPQDFPAFKILLQLCALRGITASDGKEPKIKTLFMKIYVFLEKFKITKQLSHAKSMFMTIWGFLIRLAPFLEVETSNNDFTIKFGSSEYYFELNDKLEHRLAAEACVEMGGHLARPGRKDLEQLIEHAKKHTDRINLYLDASDTKKENFYQYATGKELPGEDLWEPNEPNNKGGKQHCVVISKLSSNRLLDDVECESPQQYICQIGESEHDPIPECTTVGDGCYVYDKRKRNWHDAEKECKAMGGIYASPCKKQLDLLIKHTVSIGGRYWIGAYEIEKAKKYIYVKGTKMPCGFWGSGEPNGHGGKEKCVEISSTTKALNDLECKIDLQFICQFGEDGCNEEKDRAERAKNCVKIEDSCYVIETEETLTWEKAKKEANLYPSGQLAAPDRNEMRRLIDHVSKLGGRYWIGANDRATEGSYHYDDQEHKMPGGFWGNGEPKGTDDDEDCVEINAKKKGLADMPCSTEINYIVEIIDPSAPPKGTDKPECSKFGSSCFWINEWDELTWEEAKKACEKTGGYLASPTRTAATKGLLESLHKIGGKYWTGATDSKKEGEYKYVTGNLMIEGLWVPGEPNQGHKNQEDCIGIWSKKKGFYDENCDAKLNYICQYGEIEPQVPEPKNCETIGTGCFIIEDSMKIDWNAAKAKCESVGAKLAHPTKEQMEGLLKHLHPKGDCWWIGGSDTSKEGHWVYVNGENMPGGFWNTGEPNNCGNGEGCVEINASHQKLNDIPCNTKHPYVCQVENPGVIPKPVTESPEPGCKHEVIGSSCFMIEPDDKLTWTAAQKHCEGLGMTLAAPTNEDLQILLTHMAHKGGRYWIGAREYDNTFKFSSGSEVPCVWGPGHPEYKDDQKCVEIYAKYKSLSDGKCDTERNFICQDLTN